MKFIVNNLAWLVVLLLGCIGNEPGKPDRFTLKSSADSKDKIVRKRATEDGPVIPAYVHENHQLLLKYWLIQNPKYRVALESDCEECSEQIGFIRNGRDGPRFTIRDFTPYYTVGDLNHDGHEDFAIALIDSQKTEWRFTLLIFNGPFQNKFQKPAFKLDELSLTHGGLFFFSNAENSTLSFGPFESDSGGLVTAIGPTYQVKSSSE